MHQCVADVVGGAAVRQVQELDVAGGAVDRGADGGAVAAADDEVALPAAGHLAVGDLRRAVADQKRAA